LRASLVQCPPTQRSFTVQASPSAQSASETQKPSTGACVHPVLESQPSVVHGLPSSHSGAVPATHVPDWQVSSPLQTSRSPQDCLAHGRRACDAGGLTLVRRCTTSSIVAATTRGAVA